MRWIKKTAETKSNIIKVSVNESGNFDTKSPVITWQSTDFEVKAEENFSLLVSAYAPDYGYLSYRWFYTFSYTYDNAIEIMSGASSTIVTRMAESPKEIYYFCVITNTNYNAAGNKTAETKSGIIKVSVRDVVNAELPNIMVQPQSGIQIEQDDSVSISVDATVLDGGFLTYQWYKNTVNDVSGGMAITGAANPSFSIPTEQAGTFYYYCIVTNTIYDNGDGGMKSAQNHSWVVTVTITEKQTNPPVVLIPRAKKNVSYNKDGQIIMESTYSDTQNEIIQYHNGKIISKAIYSLDLSKPTSIKFVSINIWSSADLGETLYLLMESEYVYENSSCIRYTSFYNPDGTLKHTYKHVEYFFVDNKIIEYNAYSEAENLLSVSTYTYNDLNRLVKIESHDMNGVLVEVTIFNEQGLMSEIKNYSNSVLTSTFTYEYDAQNYYSRIVFVFTDRPTANSTYEYTFLAEKKQRCDILDYQGVLTGYQIIEYW